LSAVPEQTGDNCKAVLSRQWRESVFRQLLTLLWSAIFLRSVAAAGAACYLHVAELTAYRLKSIADGKSPLVLQSVHAVFRAAALLGVEIGETAETAGAIAEFLKVGSLVTSSALCTVFMSDNLCLTQRLDFHRPTDQNLSAYCRPAPSSSSTSL